MSRAKSRLLERKKKLLREIGATRDVLQGSLAIIDRKCGKPRCRCVKGKGHRGLFFSYRVAGATKVAYISHDRGDEARRLGANYKKLKRLLERLTDVNVRLLKLERRNP